MAEELILSISDLSRGGAGVARDQSGRVIFVPFTAPGDRVKVQIIEESKRYAQGKLIEVLDPSPLRQKPPCPYFGICGGCQWQHLSYEIQWQTKAKGVKYALTRSSIELTAPWEEFPAEQVLEYRNRIQLRGNGRELGFYAAGSHVVVPIERCLIARPEINAELENVRVEGAKLPRPFKVEIDSVITAEGVTKVRKAWNSSHGALGFRQVHDEQNEKLRKWISRNITPGRAVFDLFGGSGNLSLSLAEIMGTIDCVDVSAPIEPPAGTASNVRFHRSEVGKWLNQRRAQQGPTENGLVARSAILDPPREGLGPAGTGIIQDLKTLGVSEAILVGCDVDSWVRDLGRFLRQGWRLERIGVFDFFPQTPHIESVALIRL